jgi:hypothetical protein
MNFSKEDFKRIVGEFVQPLRRGSVEFKSKLISSLTGIIPFGRHDSAQNASPYGISSWPLKGIFGFFQNLNGDQNSPVIISHLDQKRPEPGAEGEVIFYCRKPDGSYPIQIFLKPDGLLKIQVDSKVEVKCDNIELGKDQLEKIINGETFLTFFNNHQHYFMGSPTTTVLQPMVDATHLSQKVKASK